MNKKHIAIIVLCVAIAAAVYRLYFYRSPEARKTDNLIMAIQDVTLEDAERIEEARTAYDELSVEHKKEVKHLSVLEQAELEYAELFDREAAKVVEEQIKALFPVTLDSEELIEKAKTAYEQLTEKQQSYVSNFEDIEKAKTELVELQKADFMKRVEDIENILVESNIVSKEQMEEFKNSEFYSFMEEIVESVSPEEVEELINQIATSGEEIKKAMEEYDEQNKNQDKDKTSDEWNLDFFLELFGMDQKTS